jgi:hypothetical protein
VWIVPLAVESYPPLSTALGYCGASYVGNKSYPQLIHGLSTVINPLIHSFAHICFGQWITWWITRGKRPNNALSNLNRG